MSLSTLIDTSARVLRKLSIVALASLAASACAPQAAKRPPCPAGKVCLHIGNASEAISLDPQLTTGTWEDRIMSDGIVGLTQDDENGDPIPGMAERWTTSADGLTWTFYLRDAVWSDGVPVTADDFVFSLRRILSPELASEYASLIYAIKNAQEVNEGKLPGTALGVRAVSPKILEISLVHPAPYLPQLAKHHTMFPVPKHVVEKLGSAWSRPGNWVGNGPFTVVAWKLGDHIKSVKNPKFWDADNVCVDEVYYYPTNDAISAERRVLRGELDVSTDIQSNRIALLREEHPEYLRIKTYLGVAYLAFNTKGVPAFRDRRVRLALTMAVDRDFITQKLLRGGQLPAVTFIPPGVADYKSPPAPAWSSWPFEKRQAVARALLAEAGYGPNNPLKIEIKHRNSPDPMLMMPSIQADWKAIGVNASLAQNETQIAYASYRSRNFDVADAAWIADYNDAMSFLYLQQSTTGPQNYGDYRNPEYDALLAKADREPDAAKRAQYMADAEALVLRDAPVAPIFFYVNKNLVNPDVTGWIDNIVDHHRTRYLCVKGAKSAK